MNEKRGKIKMPMDRYLQVFISVAELQNFSRAAEAHHMTQPAVSQYIRTLEEQIGSKLLDRNNQYVHPNKAGEVVYHYGKEILGLYNQIQQRVEDLINTANGPLTICASYTFGEYVLPRLIAELKKMYPDIRPTVTIGNTAKIANLVESHQLDIGIVEGHFKNKALIQEEFAEDSMVVVASSEHPLAQKERVDKSELSRQTWIVRETGSGTREATEKLFQLWNMSPAHLMHYSSTQPIKESVEAGLGVSLVSKWVVQKELKYGDLTIINADELPLKRTFAFLQQSPFQTKALEVFISLLRRNETVLT